MAGICCMTSNDKSNNVKPVDNQNVPADYFEAELAMAEKKDIK